MDIRPIAALATAGVVGAGAGMLMHTAARAGTLVDMYGDKPAGQIAPTAMLGVGVLGLVAGPALAAAAICSDGVVMKLGGMLGLATGLAALMTAASLDGISFPDGTTIKPAD